MNLTNLNRYSVKGFAMGYPAQKNPVVSSHPREKKFLLLEGFSFLYCCIYFPSIVDFLFISVVSPPMLQVARSPDSSLPGSKFGSLSDIVTTNLLYSSSFCLGHVSF